MNHRRGFATAIALSLVALVGLASAGLMLTFSTEAERTRDEAIDAQLRQILLAATVQVGARAADGNTPSSQLTGLPSELAGDGAKVAVKWKTNRDIATSNIQIIQGHHHAEEELHFTRDGNHWRDNGTAIIQ